MLLEYTQDNGQIIKIETDTSTSEEIEEFIYNEIYDFTKVTLSSLGKDPAKEEILIDNIANDHAYDNYKNLLSQDELDKIVDDITKTLIGDWWKTLNN